MVKDAYSDSNWDFKLSSIKCNKGGANSISKMVELLEGTDLSIKTTDKFFKMVPFLRV